MGVSLVFLFLFSFFLQPPYVSLDPAFGFLVIGKFLLVAFECGSVIVAAAVDMFCRVMDVEHFVIDDVFDDVTRRFRRVQRYADGDMVVGRVVVAEDAVGLFGGPRQCWFGDRVAKIFGI